MAFPHDMITACGGLVSTEIILAHGGAGLTIRHDGARHLGPLATSAAIPSDGKCLMDRQARPGHADASAHRLRKTDNRPAPCRRDHGAPTAPANPVGVEPLG